MIKVRKRTKVLKYSLNLERLASDIVAYLLNIESSKDSYSFGNKSTALTFNQKLNLLIDNETITKKEKEKLVYFMSIRNQFMHNIDANTFTDAFQCIDGLENKMRKIYPENFTDDREESLEKCVDSLLKDGISILFSSKGNGEKKLNIEAQAEIYKKYYNKQSLSIRTNFRKFKEALKEIEDKSIDKTNCNYSGTQTQ